MPANIARALIDGLSQDVIASDNDLDELIPQDLLDFEASARDALEADRQHAIPARWVESAAVCETFRPEYAFYAKQAEGDATTAATADAVCETLLIAHEVGGIRPSCASAMSSIRGA